MKLCTINAFDTDLGNEYLVRSSENVIFKINHIMGESNIFLYHFTTRM